MKITNVENLFTYIKTTHALKNKEIGDILGVSESLIHYYTKGKRNPENLDIVLKTFNFKGYPSAEAFQAVIDKHASKLNKNISVNDFNYVIFAKNVWFDLSENRVLRESEFNKDEEAFAREIYRVFKEGKANLLIPNFDTLISDLNSSGQEINPCRVRFMIMNLLKDNQLFENVKNFGYSLSSPTFKDTARLEAKDLQIEQTLDR